MSALLLSCEDRTQPIGVESLVDLAPGRVVELWSAAGVDMGPVVEVSETTLTVDSWGVPVRWQLADLDGGEIDGDGRVVLFHSSMRGMP